VENPFYECLIPNNLFEACLVYYNIFSVFAVVW
jgi:hypothetical protein